MTPSGETNEKSADKVKANQIIHEESMLLSRS
jgi:hypothetical protein